MDKIAKFTTIIEYNGERVELELEEPMTQEEFIEIKKTMVQMQFESDLVKEMEAVIAENELKSEDIN